MLHGFSPGLRRVALAFALGLTLTATAQTPDPAKAAQLYKEGQDLLAANDPVHARLKFVDAAQLGSADAENEVGKLYLAGNGVDQSSDEATYWFNRSAQNGNIRGMTNLGLMYMGDRGIPTDHEKAVQWLTKAAEQGQPLAQWQLGTLYQRGQGAPQDAAKAAEWFAKSAEQGNAEAQNALGLLYLNGTGVPKDLEKALHLFTDAADKGQPIASYQIACYYEYGKGMTEDHVKAMQWFLKSAQDGYKEAQIVVGDRYLKGDTASGVAKDVNKAVEWYKKAIEGRDPEIVAKIGARMDDVTSPIVDQKQAFSLFIESAQAGNAFGQYRLAKMYKPDPIDTVIKPLWDRDLGKAVDLFKASADQGYGSALDELARLYYLGEGVEKSVFNAYVFAALAVERGAPWAERVRDTAAAELTPAQLEEAKGEIERRKATWK